jgi:tetratricopeptide (TPR) repeat protein
MRSRHLGRLAVAALMLTVAEPAVTSAQTLEKLEERVRKLYSSASYEEALALVGNTAEPGVQQYRVLCLLALGRQQEAKVALNALVTAAPDFAVSEDLPPRFITMLSQTRQQVLPSILRAWFAEARDHYQKQAYDQARSQFERVLALTSDAAVKDMDGLADLRDLRLLADGYLELIRELQTPKLLLSAPAPVVPATPTPPVPAAPVASPAPTVRTPPSVISQVIPPWPSEAGEIDLANVGLLRVLISRTGRVSSATMIRSVHPRYDWELIASTRRWQYKPATIDGAPVESESTVEIRLSAPRR